MGSAIYDPIIKNSDKTLFILKVNKFKQIFFIVFSRLVLYIYLTKLINLVKANNNQLG